MSDEQLSRICLSLTPRDLAILMALYRYRYLNVFQIQQLFFPSIRSCQIRLKQLHELGVIHRWKILEAGNFHPSPMPIARPPRYTRRGPRWAFDRLLARARILWHMRPVIGAASQVTRTWQPDHVCDRSPDSVKFGAEIGGFRAHDGRGIAKIGHLTLDLALIALSSGTRLRWI